jgi:hypothetical protein
MSRALKIMYVVVLAVSFIAVAAFAQGNDVYNFYFQKAPGPQTVIQGGGQAQQPSSVVVKDGEVVQNTSSQSQVPAVPPATSSQNVTSVPTAEELANAKKTWEVFGGVGLVGEGFDQHRGYSLGANYNFSKYFGVGVAATYAPETLVLGSGYSSYTRERVGSPWDGAIEAIVMPLHIQLFGYDFLELGVVGGAMTVQSNKQLHGFWGPRIGININPNFGLIGEWRTTGQDLGITQFTGGLKVRF